MDRVEPNVRSRMMSRIRSKDTIPELRVRRYLHRAGLRYRVHVANLPGAPDIVFPSRRLCVFVNGCFWHGCRKCRDGQRQAQSNREYWLPKIARNRERDRAHYRDLRRQGWTVAVIWECETENEKKLSALRDAISAVTPN